MTKDRRMYIFKKKKLKHASAWAMPARKGMHVCHKFAWA